MNDEYQHGAIHTDTLKATEDFFFCILLIHIHDDSNNYIHSLVNSEENDYVLIHRPFKYTLFIV